MENSDTQEKQPEKLEIQPEQDKLESQNDANTENKKKKKDKKKVEITVDELMKWDKKSKDLSRQIQQLTKENSELKLDLEELQNSQQNQTGKSKIALEGLEERCKILQQSLDNQVESSNNYQTQLKTIESEYFLLKQDYELQENELNNLRNEIQDKFELQQNYTDLSNQLKQMEKYKKYESKNEELEKNLLALESEKQKMQTDFENQVLQFKQEKKQIEDYDLQIENLQKQNQALTLQLEQSNQIKQDQANEIKLYQNMCEENTLEMSIQQKKHQKELKCLQMSLQHIQDENIVFKKQNENFKIDLENAMQAKNVKSKVTKDEKIIVEQMSNTIDKISIQNADLSSSNQQLSKENEDFRKVIVLLENNFFNFVKKLKSVQLQTSASLDKDDWREIENMIQNKEKMQLVQEVLVENFQLKKDMQVLCSEFNKMNRK